MCLMRLGTNLRLFQGARPDHVRVESSSCSVSVQGVGEFSSSEGVDCFDTPYVQRSRPFGKRFLVGKIISYLILWMLLLNLQ